MASKQIIRSVKLSRWFPPHDPLAASLARLCILREDFMLETRGLMDVPISQLDTHSSKWRKLYFLRRAVQTLEEIRSSLETLRRSADFKRLLSKQLGTDRKRFEMLSNKMSKAQGLLNDLRNKLGGHVLHGSVQDALLGMGPDREGLIEVGAKLKDTHYKFAGELVLEIMLTGVPEQDRMSHFVDAIDTISGLLPSLSLIGDLVTWYAVDRHLV